jgi:hypothetical protein
MGLVIEVANLAKHEDVIATANGIQAVEDRLEQAIRFFSARLIGARAIESPLGQIRPALEPRGLFENLRLGAKFLGRLTSIHPNVLGLDHG